MTQGSRLGVPRRTVLAGVGVAVMSATACGIRLEDDAPRIPLVPTRTPVPAEAELVRLTRETAALADLAVSVPGALAAELAGLHRHQYSVLRSALVAQGVPAAALEVSPSVTPSGSPTPAPTPARTSPAQLATAEAASAAAAASFAGVAPDLAPTVAALHAQRYAAATLLAGRPPAVPGDPVGGKAAGTLATSTSAAAYFLEVVGARSAGAQQARATSTLLALRGLLADQQAGGARPDVALGHPLPFPVTTPASAARLARASLAGLRAGYGEQLGAVVASDHGPGLAALTRWLGTVEVEAHRWGVALAPFPGLQ